MSKPGPKPGSPAYRPPRPIKERILNRVEVDDGGCWNWTGPRNAKGYGNTFVGSRVDGTRRWASIHRLAYMEWKGAIPEGMQIDHLCNNTSCCNPDHLEVVDNAENMRRQAAQSDTCKNGHAWTTENTYIHSDGRRRCRACKNEAGRRAYKKHGFRPWTAPEAECPVCHVTFRAKHTRNICCSRSCAAKLRHSSRASA